MNLSYDCAVCGRCVIFAVDMCVMEYALCVGCYIRAARGFITIYLRRLVVV
jgi:hypothetical protein